MRRSLAAFALILVAMSSGCTDPCSIPMENPVQLRIVNAMADQGKINIYLNGEGLQLGFAYDPPLTYVPALPKNEYYAKTTLGGAPLRSGDSQTVVVTSMEGDTLFNERVSFHVGRQTMIIIGRAREFDGRNTRRIMLLKDDESRFVNGKTLARYVHAIPDLEALDVYFLKANGQRDLTPNLVIDYGVATDYLTLPEGVQGLLVTAKNDTNEVFLRIDQGFGISLFATVILRGGVKAQGTEPTATTLVLSDRNLGNYVFNITSFLVRFVNGGRTEPMSVLIRGYRADKIGMPRAEIPGQKPLLCIPPDSVGGYASLTPDFHSKSDWYFNLGCEYHDSTKRVHMFVDSLGALRRFSMAALVTTPLGQTEQWDHLVLPDTMRSPAASAFGRVRFVNLSPDADVNIEGTTLDQKGVIFRDYPVGTKTIVTNGKTINIQVENARPRTVWFSAATASDPLPYTISD